MSSRNTGVTTALFNEIKEYVNNAHDSVCFLSI